MQNLNIQFSAIGITETWLQNASHSLDINGFSFFHKHRSNRIGGGVGLYLSENFDSRIRDDLCFDNDAITELLFLEINNSIGKNIIIGVIYRPPDQDVASFLPSYNKLLSKITKENKICYIMGDFNLNLLRFQQHSLTGEFLEQMYSNAFFPLILRPSRITSHSATLIDNIFINQLHSNLKSGLLFTDISDHLPVFSICHETVQTVNRENEIIKIREKNNYNLHKFREQLSQVNWSELEGFNDPNQSYNVFHSNFSNIYNSCFPIKQIKRKHHFSNKPWLTKGILNSIKRKNKLYRRYLRSPTLQNESYYKTFKNKLNHTIKIAKSLHYAKKLQNIKSDMKSTWKILNEVINKKSISKPTKGLFKTSDNTEISDPFLIANKFCNCFTNVGPNLAKNIKSSSLSHCEFLSGCFPQSPWKSLKLLSRFNQIKPLVMTKFQCQ